MATIWIVGPKVSFRVRPGRLADSEGRSLSDQLGAAIARPHLTPAVRGKFDAVTDQAEMSRSASFGATGDDARFGDSEASWPPRMTAGPWEPAVLDLPLIP